MGGSGGGGGPYYNVNTDELRDKVKEAGAVISRGFDPQAPVVPRRTFSSI